MNTEDYIVKDDEPCDTLSEKEEIAKRMFHLLPGKDYTSRKDLRKYVEALESYLKDGIDMDDSEVDGDSFSEDAEAELGRILVDEYPSAQAAYASLVGPVLPEDEAREELIADDRVSYIHDGDGFIALFYND